MLSSVQCLTFSYNSKSPNRIEPFLTAQCRPMIHLRVCWHSRLLKKRSRGEERRRPEHLGRMSRWRTVPASKKILSKTVSAKLILRFSPSCMISGWCPWPRMSKLSTFFVALTDHTKIVAAAKLMHVVSVLWSERHCTCAVTVTLDYLATGPVKKDDLATSAKQPVESRFLLSPRRTHTPTCAPIRWYTRGAPPAVPRRKSFPRPIRSLVQVSGERSIVLDREAGLE
jgi:hypothetical protein